MRAAKHLENVQASGYPTGSHVDVGGCSIAVQDATHLDITPTLGDRKSDNLELPLLYGRASANSIRGTGMLLFNPGLSPGLLAVNQGLVVQADQIVPWIEHWEDFLQVESEWDPLLMPLEIVSELMRNLDALVVAWTKRQNVCHILAAERGAALVREAWVP